jgi:hypothetical protein
MHVLLVSSFVLPHAGGVEQFVATIRRMLEDRGHVVRLLACRLPGRDGTADAVVPALLRAFQPQLLVTQCGVDTHRLDPLANLRLTVDGQRAAYLALRALADLAALAGPSTAMRHLIDDPMRTLDGGGRFRAAVDEASAALSAPARAILNELAAHSEGATVDRVIELCRQCDANLEALVELVDTALVMVERPGGEAVYRVPAPLQWLLAPHTARVRRQPLPTLANAVRLDPGLVRVS